MKLGFDKYQGTGNDFIIIDNRQGGFPSQNQAFIEKLCHRRFGIGADGLILVEVAEGYDFRMVYFNSDGKESSMCGNGGRCVAAFAHAHKIAGDIINFIAIDGPHEAEIKSGTVKLKMMDVPGVEIRNSAFVLNTGSPHYVKVLNEDIAGVNIVDEAHKIRYSDEFAEKGINVNFINSSEGNKLAVRTYERGVEDETFSCGTGVVASAISSFIYAHEQNPPEQKINSYLAVTKGGNLEVNFSHEGNLQFKNVWLSGTAEFVFNGEFYLPE